ncbi:AT-rich interactive domain-containing protein 4B isoform X2 [Ictalurus punctatus]|uniref:AT-rich interactive domain-containing protein 4B isoform X2 n=1 Tax=Ictalurus punctatus TaxID=7998 RepID=A0A9F7THI8_ICTPU|nr:AT-rich interactive domain-containing protein 4B isoform X2 [Ictalurus punctatus]
MKTIEEPAYLTVGTDVSAKYRGAFCEAKIKTAKKLVKAKVTFKPDLSTAEVHDEHIRGNLKVGAVVEVKNQDGIYQEATITKLTDASLYTVVFDDGDEKTLRRSSLCLKGARHFAESETLDRLPLTNPEHFGTPVIGKKGNRGRRSNAIQEEESSSSSSEEEDGDPQQNEELYGKVVGVEGVVTGDKKKTLWFPALRNASSLIGRNFILQQDNDPKSTVNTTKDFIKGKKWNDLDWPSQSIDLNPVEHTFHPLKRRLKGETSQNKQQLKEAAVQACTSLVMSVDHRLDAVIASKVISPDCHEDVVMKKDSVFVRSFKDGKFHMVLRKDIKELDGEMDPKAEASLKPVLNAAWDFQCNGTVPSAWRTEIKDESSSSDENDEEEEEVQEDGGSSEEEEEEVEPFPEERENFLQQLYKFMEDRGTPINKRPVLGYRNLNLFKLYRLVHKLGGFDSIESGSIWKQVYQDLGIPVLNSAAGYNVKCAYRKYLYGFEDYCTSTGITFRMDLPFKALESSHTDNSVEGPAERTIIVDPKSDPEISLSTKNIIKEEKSEEAGLLKTKVNITSLKEEDRICSDEEDNGIDKEPHKLKAEEAAPTEGPSTENMKVEPCKDQNKELLRDDSSQEWEEGEEFECYPPGMKVQVRYGRGRNQKTYEATVKESDLEGGEVLYLVHYCGWNVRYDEWIKADKIVQPANKNVPKIKHRKKIKNKNERDRIENLNDREDLPPTNRSSKPVSGNDDFPKMEEFIDADVQKSPVKSLKITSNLNGLQAPESSIDHSIHEQDEKGDHNNDCPVGQLSPQRRAPPELHYTALQWESEPSTEGHKASVSMGTAEVSSSQYSPETNKQLVTEGEASSIRRRKADVTTEHTHKIQFKGKTRGSKLSDWLSESSLKKLEERNIGPRDGGMQSSSSSEDEGGPLMESQAKEELLMHHKAKGVPSKKYNGLKEKAKGGRSSTFWEIPDKRAKITSGMDDRTPGCRTKGQKDVWSSIQAQWPKKTLKELFSDSDTEAANSPPPVVPGLSDPEPEREQKSEKPDEPQESQENNQEYPSSGSNSILNTPPTTPESAEVLHEMHSSSPPPQSSVLASCSPATSSPAGPLIEECVGGRSESDTSTVEMDTVSCEFHMLPQEEQSGSSSKAFDANLSSNSSCSLSLSSSSQQESEQKAKVSSSNQKRHKDSQGGGASKKHKQSHKTLNLHPKTNHKTANSSDSEDQCLSVSAAKSFISKSSTQDMKAITLPKGSARTPSSHKYHKHGDAEHLHPKEQHSSSRGSRTYKWSFQMSDLEKMSSLEKIAFLQEKLQDIRNHYLLLKSEVASIDRRRKRMKKKERETGAAAVLYSSSSSPSSSSLTAAVMLTLAEPTVSGSSQNSGVSLECR